jgi:phosphomannomutase
VKREIFKAYDIRGIYPDDLDAEAARAIGQAVARFLRGSPVVVGHDMRESGLPLGDGLREGLLGEGVDVLDIGRVATPMVYFATTVRRAAGGVMITASHNPGRYNGFKICREAAIPVGIETGLAEIRDLAHTHLGAPVPPPRGRSREERVQEEYFESLLKLFPSRPALQVVVDAGNGIAGEAISRLLDRLPLRVTRLYFEPDGSFPNHEADPLKAENLQDLTREVRLRGADFGVAFDGDGDRAVFVDETGEPVPADLMMAVLTRVAFDRALLGAASGAPVVYDLRSSRVVPEVIRACGGVPIRSRVGHAFMKQRMRDAGAFFGGELSAHYYFRFPAGYVADDGAAALLLVMEVLALTGTPLSELWRPFRRYCQSGEVNRRVQNVPRVLQRLREAFPDGRVDELDGLTIEYPDWWCNVRPSNTEPLLRINVETGSEEELGRHLDDILDLIDEARPRTPE